MTDAAPSTPPDPPAQPERAKPYGTARGARKAGRKAAALAKQIAQPAPRPEPFQGSAAEAAVWDAVYAHKPSCYRDRHLLRAEFPELMPAAVRLSPRTHIPPLPAAPSAPPDLTLLEVGCGHGSALFPLLRANPRLFALACDFSSRAVALVRSHEEFCAERVQVFQADVTDWRTLEGVVGDGVQFVTAFWTLSALCGQGLVDAAGNIGRIVREGGLLFVRDFAEGDMREGRCRGRGMLVERGVAGEVFRRGDGTIVAFFTEGGLRRVFEGVGFRVVRGGIVERVVENRKEGVAMRRRWIQMVFQKMGRGDGGVEEEGCFRGMEIGKDD